MPLLGWDAERFGMGPAVMLGQDLADVARPVGEGAVADLAAGDRQMGDGHREAAGTWRAHHLPSCQPCCSEHALHARANARLAADEDVVAGLAIHAASGTLARQCMFL